MTEQELLNNNILLQANAGDVVSGEDPTNPQQPKTEIYGDDVVKAFYDSTTGKWMSRKDPAKEMTPKDYQEGDIVSITPGTKRKGGGVYTTGFLQLQNGQWVETDLKQLQPVLVKNFNGKMKPDMFTELEKAKQDLNAYAHFTRGVTNTDKDIENSIQYQYATEKESEVREVFNHMTKEFIKSGEYKKFLTKKGSVDQEKLLDYTLQLSQKYGGGRAVREMLKLEFENAIAAEQIKPTAQKAFEREFLKRKGQTPDQYFKEKYGVSYSEFADGSAFKKDYEELALLRQNAIKNIDMETARSNEFVQKKVNELAEQKYKPWAESINKLLSAAPERQKAEWNRMMTEYAEDLRKIRMGEINRVDRLRKELLRGIQSKAKALEKYNLPPDMAKELDDIWGIVYDDAAKTMQKVRELTQDAEFGAFGGGHLFGKAFTAAFANSTANKGEALVAFNINNKFTDWLRGWETVANDYQVVQPKMAGNWFNPQAYITRTAQVMGNAATGILASAFTHPLVGGLISFADDTMNVSGEEYKNAIRSGDNHVEASRKAMTLANKNATLLPFYFLESLGIKSAMKGWRGMVAGAGLETAGEVPQELLQQHFQNQNQAGYNKSFLEYAASDEGRELALDTVISTLGMTGSMSTVGEVTSALGRTAPNADRQHLANMIMNHGVNAARAVVELEYQNGVIDLATLKRKKEDIAKLYNAIGGLKKLGGMSNAAKSYFIGVSKEISDLTAEMEGAADAQVKKVLEQKIKEKEQELSDLSQGKLSIASITTPSGATIGVRLDKASELLSQESFVNGIREGAIKVEILGEDANAESLRKAVAEIEIAENIPDTQMQIARPEEIEDRAKKVEEFTEEQKKQLQEIDQEGTGVIDFVGAVANDVNAKPVTEDMFVDSRKETKNPLRKITKPTILPFEWLVGKKVAYIQSDHLTVGDVDGIDAMGGVLFPLMQGNVDNGIIWAGDSQGAVTKIVNAARKVSKDGKTGYAVIALMDSSSNLSNNRFARLWAKSVKKKLSKEEQAELLDEVKAKVVQLSQHKSKDSKIKPVHAEVVASAKNLDQLVNKMATLPMAARAQIMDNITTRRGVDHSGSANATRLLTLQQGRAKTHEELLEAFREPLTKGSKAGSMVAVVEVDIAAHDKWQQENEARTGKKGGQPTWADINKPELAHDNYDYPVFGRVVGYLDKQVHITNANETALSEYEQKYKTYDGGKEAAGLKGVERKDYSAEDLKRHTQASKELADQGKDSNSAGFANSQAARNMGLRGILGASEEQVDEKAVGEITPAEVTEARNKPFQNFVKLLNKAFPNIEVVADNPTVWNDLYDKLYDAKAGYGLYTKVGSLYGIIHQGKVYLNPKFDSYNTAIHEFGHIWLNVAKAERKDLYKQGMELISGNDELAQYYRDKVTNSNEYKKHMKLLKDKGFTEKQLQEYINNEALATLIGDRGEGFINAMRQTNAERYSKIKDLYNRVNQWINDLFNYIKQYVGVKGFSPDMTLKEFADAVVAELMSGEKISDISSKEMARKQKTEQMAAGEEVAGEHEGRKIYYATDTQAFHNALKSAVDKRPQDGNSVDVKSVEDLQAILDKGGRLYLAEDGSFGAALYPDGYMGTLFKDPDAPVKGVAKALQEMRIKDGGYFMEAYGHHLEDLYIKNGFRPVARLKFNEEYAPEGWEKTALASRPDVVFFVYDPAGEYQKGDGLYFEDYRKAYTFAEEYKVENTNEAAKTANSRTEEGSQGTGHAPSQHLSNANERTDSRGRGGDSQAGQRNNEGQKDERAVESKLVEAVKANISSWLHQGKTDAEINQRLRDTLFIDEATATELINDARNNYQSEKVVSNPPSTKSVIAANTDSRNTNKITLKETTALKNQIKEKFRGMAIGYKQGRADQREQQARYDQWLNTLRELVDQALKDAVKAGKMSTQVSGTIAANIMKQAVNAKTPLRLVKLINRIDKYILDVDYARKLSQAKALKKAIRTATKSKSYQRAANNVAHAKAFLSINPSEINNIDEYIDIATRINNMMRGAKVKVDKTHTDAATATNTEYSITNKQIEDYVNRIEEEAQRSEFDSLLRQYEEMMLLSVIDPSSLSLEELRELVEAWNYGDNANIIAEAKWAAEQAKMHALRQMIEYAKIGLEEHVADNAGTFSKEQEKVLKRLMELDIEKLTATQLIKFNDVINNIVYNDSFAGSGDLANLSQARKGAAELRAVEKASGIKLSTIKTAFVKGAASAQLMFEFIAKSTKLAAEIQRLTGIADIFNGHAQAKQLFHATMKEYRKMKDKMGNKINSAENRYRRGVLARIMQHYGGTQEEIKAEFDRVKALVLETAQKLQNSGLAADQKEGQLVQQVYDELLKNSTSIEDVIAASNAINPHNEKLVRYWQAKHAEIRQDFLEQAEIYNNEIGDDIVNYTSTAFRLFGSSDQTAANAAMFKDQFTARAVNNRPAGSKFKRGSFEHLGNRVLDLDFDDVQARRYYENVYDLKNGQNLSVVRAFFADQATADELLGGPHNRKLILHRLEQSVKVQRGKTEQVGAMEDFLEKALATLQAKGVRMALASLSQPLKQYPSVALGAIANLGKDMDLFMTNLLNPWKAKKLLEQFNIGERGATKASSVHNIEFETMERTDFSSGENAVIGTVQKWAEKLSDAAMKPLTMSDVAVARTAWLAYYAQSLRQQGLLSKKWGAVPDWEAEAANPNKIAAAYAEQMVSRTQNANDVSSMPEFFQKRGTTAIMKNLFLPFSSFSTNQRMRMTNDVQKLFSKDGAKGEAVKSLVATLIEQGAFNAVKVYGISLWVDFIFSSMANLLGVWDEEDEANKGKYDDLALTNDEGEVIWDKGLNKKSKKWAANTFHDYFFSGIGTLPGDAIKVGMNIIYAAAANESAIDKEGNVMKTKDMPDLFYRPNGNDISFSSWGIYGSTIEHTWNILSNLEEGVLGTGDYIKRGKKGEEVDVVLHERERRAILVMMAMEAFALAGVSDADVLQANAQLRRHMERKMEKKYGGTEYTIKSRGKSYHEDGTPIELEEEEDDIPVIPIGSSITY